MMRNEIDIDHLKALRARARERLAPLGLVSPHVDPDARAGVVMLPYIAAAPLPDGSLGLQLRIELRALLRSGTAELARVAPALARDTIRAIAPTIALLHDLRPEPFPAMPWHATLTPHDLSIRHAEHDANILRAIVFPPAQFPSSDPLAKATAVGALHRALLARLRAELARLDTHITGASTQLEPHLTPALT
jgi:hypothetical protein